MLGCNQNGTEKKKCDQVHGICSPYSTANVHGIADGEMVLPFPKVFKWRSSYGMGFMWNCRSGIPHVESQ